MESLSAQSPESVRLPIFLAMLLIMFVIERLTKNRPLEVGLGKRWGFHVVVSVFNTVVTRLLAVAPFILWLEFIDSQPWGVCHWLGLTGWIEVVITVIAFDWYDYWWHRFNHRWPILWRFHQVHHADVDIDVTTSLRFHPGELIFSYGAKALWIAIWGPSVFAFVVCEMAITFFSQFHHSNFDFPDWFERVFRWLHITPRLHASHHTMTTRTRNANYSTIFSIWDRLFGTFEEPDKEEMQKMGLPYERESSFNGWALLKMPFMSQRSGTQ